MNSFSFKYLAIAVLLASTLTGCGEKIPVVDEERPCLSFSPTHPGTEVKSLLNTQAELQASSGVGLFGTVSHSETTSNPNQTIFYNDHLHYASSAWTYDYLLYWVKGGFYNFAAVYPYSSGSGSVGSGSATYTFNATTAEPTLSIPATTTWESPDLMYGFATRDLTSSENYSVVPIDLKHAFAALEFKVVNASGETVTNLSDVALKNIIISSTMTASASSTAPEWEEGTRSDESTWDGYTQSGVVYSSIPYGSTQYSLFDGPFVVIPQSVVNTSAGISFSKVGGNDQNNISLSLGNIADVKKWEAGKKYTYIITIQSSAITFTVTVVDWIEHTYRLN